MCILDPAPETADGMATTCLHSAALAQSARAWTAFCVCQLNEAVMLSKSWSKTNSCNHLEINDVH